MGDIMRSTKEPRFPTRVLKPGVLPNVLICRQPIFDRYLRVIGYEILYRNQTSETATNLNGGEETSQIILNTLADIGLERVVGQQKAFINLTRNFFLKNYPIPFSPRQIVIEVSENQISDNEILEHIRNFSLRGYQIALDDVVSMEPLESLVNIVDIYKLDLALIAAENIQPMANRFHFQRGKFLAERVETQDQFDLCMAAGFDYFQGFFLCRPKIISGLKVSSGHYVLMELLAVLQNPEVGFKELEDIISQDAILGYKLLRLTNSAYYGVRWEIKSIRQAMILLGLNKLRSWLALILLTQKGNHPRELSILAMVRARMSELLAIHARLSDPDSFFLAGLLSALDAMMGITMDELMEGVRLSSTLKEGLLEGKGMIGQALQCTLAYERAEWEKVYFMQLSSDLIRDIYLQSLLWVETMRKAVDIGS